MTDEAEDLQEAEGPVEGGTPSGPDSEAEDDAPLHPLQKLLDNPWLLLLLGFVVPSLSYTAWGWIELLLTKPAELP